MILSKGIPSKIAVTIDVIINEINVFNFKKIISDNNTIIPITTVINGQIVSNIIVLPFQIKD